MNSEQLAGNRYQLSVISRQAIAYFSLLIALFLFASCSFDYGPSGDTGPNRPDIVMEDIEYIRVLGGDPQVRFAAELAERWEDLQIMELRNFTFEQLEDWEGTVNAEGSAGAAVVQLESGDVAMSSGVIINIESEDIRITTIELEWRDEERFLFGRDDTEVEIGRSDGTNFTGRGFSVYARSREWAFTGEVQGVFVEEDDDEEDPDETAEESLNGDAAAAEWTGTEPRQPLPPRRISN
ncbi:MAG: LPS export ABC transporter periplasmic protein LptC [Treponema sp.]|nr:LPS export ABC transporter periplasmic protein LptC [Treponema sp.]